MHMHIPKSEYSSFKKNLNFMHNKKKYSHGFDSNDTHLKDSSVHMVVSLHKVSSANEKMSSKKVRGSAGEKTLSPEEQEAKINEIRKLIGPATSKVPVPCSDDIISRYLRARNWNTKKATKMLKDTIKWRMEHKPEKIRWEDIAQEAETGKIYRANYHDKQGRTVLVMRPGFQNTNSTKGQIKYLVYCIENALMNLNPDQEEMVWLIDFQGWTMSSISMKVTRETANILQDHYPERLGLAILYNPPKIFESFWTMVRPFLETKTYQKVKFVYSNDAVSQKKMEELFDMDTLESSFGGRNSTGFNYETYAKQMMEDDKKMANFINSGCSSLHFQPSFVASEASDGSGIASSHENPPVSCKDVPKIEADMPKEMQKGRVSGE